MNWNRVSNNQAAILASAAIALNRICSHRQPALAAIGGDAANPMRRVFARQIFPHKQTVTSLAAKQGPTFLLGNHPRLAFKRLIALVTRKRDSLYPSQVPTAAHLIRGKGIGGALSCTKGIADLMIVRGGILAENISRLAFTRAKACLVCAMARLLIFVAAFLAVICYSVSFGHSSAGTAAILRIARFGGYSMKCLLALLTGDLNFHGRIIPQFAGSGTTQRAAKDLGMRAIGIEIEEKYCQIAVERLRQRSLLTACV
jgi:hypothetical protein